MVRLAAGIKEEFHLSNLSLHHPQPRCFVSGQCQSRVLYGCWRVFWAAYHVTWVLLSWVLEPWGSYGWPERVKWFIYLTNWTYLLLTLLTVLEAVNFFYVRAVRTDIVQCGKQAVPMPWYLKLQWTLYNVATTGSLMVTAWYWTMLYKGDKEMGAVRIAFHAANSLYVLLNLLMTSTPTRLLHCLHPVLFGVVYTVFTALYHVAGGTNVQGQRYVYRVTDWDRPARTLLTSSLSNFLAVPLTHLAVFMLRWGAEKGWTCWRGSGRGGGGAGRGAAGVACIDLGGEGAAGSCSSVQGEPLVDGGE
ncbi:protein rolling stone-like [Babylonia areolata]|uniref:protein rolling stone-like n=1 Tax=Babylonia areolata TaxID=304850 RepID=UPI003FCEFD7C